MQPNGNGSGLEIAALSDIYRETARRQLLRLEPASVDDLTAEVRGVFGDMVRTATLREVATNICTLGSEQLRNLLSAFEPIEGIPQVAPSWPTIPESWLYDHPPTQAYLLRHPTRNGEACAPRTGDGLVPRGKAITMSAAGGVGKTMVLIQLAVSVVVGMPWLGYYHVDSGGGGRVLLLLGEEDSDDAWRRVYYVADALQLDAGDRRMLTEQLVIVPLAGKVFPLLELQGTTVLRTRHLDELHEQIGRHNDWSFVALDPQARFAGVEVESNNAMATRFVQEVEAICAIPSRPTTMVVAHSSKLSRRMGSVDSRGVTALTDGFRWHGTLASEGPGVRFEVSKNNYGRPSDALWLARGEHGILGVESDEQKKKREEATSAKSSAATATRLAAMSAVAVKVVEGVGGCFTGGRESLAKQIGGRLADARAAVDMAVDRKVLVANRIPGTKALTYTLPPPHEEEADE